MNAIQIYFLFPDVLDNKEDIIKLRLALINVTSFHFENPDSEMIKKITSTFRPIITKFYIVNCNNYYNPVIRSPIVPNFRSLLDFVKLNGRNLRHIYLESCYIDDKFLQSLARVKNLKLKTFYLKKCENFTDFGLRRFFEIQNKIIDLDLSGNDFLTNKILYEICFYLPKIKSFNIRSCNGFTDVSSDFYKNR